MTRLPVPRTLDSSPVESRIDLSNTKSGSAETADDLAIVDVIKDDKIAVIKQSNDTDLQSHEQNINSSAIVKEIGSPAQDSVDGSITAVKSTKRNKKIVSNVKQKSTDPVEVTGLYYDYFVIPDGHVWLAGDNVANSTDSR